VLLYQVIDLHLPYRAIDHVVGQVCLMLLLLALLSTTCGSGSIMQELLAVAHHIIEAIQLLRPLLVLLLGGN
jgi:hypothetical protein